MKLVTAEERAAEQRKEEIQQRRNECSWMGIPERYRFMADPAAVVQDTQAIVMVKELQRAEIIVLSGAAGCGKTAAACWWLMQAKQRYANGPLFVTAQSLARVSRYDEDTIGRIFKAQQVAIDDLGAEYADEKGFFHSFLDEVINERYSNKLPTLITTNVEGEAFKVRYGERIADRIRESGQFVSLDNPSMRKRT